MAWSISDLFPPWGDSGERPPDNYDYSGGDQVNQKHFDYLWNQVTNMEDEIRSAFTDIDSDKDGIVDKADEADTVVAGGNLKGDLKAVDGEVIWDESSTHIPDAALKKARTDVSERGTLVVSDVEDINFTDDISATDDGDGSVTVSTSAADTAFTTHQVLY